MKKKTKLILGIFATIILLLLGSRYFRLPFFDVRPTEAIPNQTALVLFLDQNALARPAKNEPLRWLHELFVPDEVAADLKGFQKYFDKEVPLPPDASFIATINPSRTTGMDVLYIFEGFSKLDLQTLLKTTDERQVRQSIFNGHTIYNVNTKDEKYALTTFRNLLVFSRYAYLVENAISQLNNPAQSFRKDADFNKMAKCEGGQALVNLKEFGAQFAPLLQPPSLATVSSIGQAGNWLQVRFPTKKGTVTWAGSYVPNCQHPLMAAQFSAKELPFKNVFRAVPDNIGVFVWSALRSFHPENARSTWNGFFEKWASNEALIALGEPLENGDTEHFLLLKTDKDPKKTEESLEKFSKKTGNLGAYPYQMFKVWQVMGNELSEMFQLGDGMKNPYMTVLGEYVLFSNSKAGLERWLDKYLAGQTFSKNAVFLQSLRPLPSEAIGFVFVESGKAWQQISPFLDEKVQASTVSNPMRFGQMSVAVQRNGGLCEFTAVCGKGVEQTATKPANILWRTSLAAAAAMPPFVYQNPANGEREIFVQDKNHQLYLISQSGRVLWRRKLEEPLLSKIFPINLYNNRQQQLCFSTASKIYVIDPTDPKGGDVAGFPLTLQTPATNGVTVVDFFGSQEYQFFIACNNGQAYGFDENGRPVEGWRPHEGVGMVPFPLLHFQTGGMDFMVLQNETGTLQVFQKNGENRFPEKKLAASFPQCPDYQIHKTASRIVACDSVGGVRVINLKGDYFKLNLKVGNQQNVKFLFADVTGDDRNDYIGLSGKELAIYFYDKNTFKKTANHSFPDAPDGLFRVDWQGSKRSYIGTVNVGKKQISMLDGQGQMLPQFPLAGTTPYIICDLAGDGKPALVVGYDEHIYAYGLEK